MKNNKVRPQVLPGITYKMPTGCGNMFITLNEHDGRLTEVFIAFGKSGACFSAQAEVIARLLNIALRHDVDLEEIIHELSNIRCVSHHVHEGEYILSCGDAIAKVLKDYLQRKKESEQQNVESNQNSSENL